MTFVADAAGPLTAGDITRLTLVALAIFTCYAFACLFWWGSLCGKCEGKGGFPSPSGKYWRPCPRCKGSPRKVRLGARVLRFVRRVLFTRNKD